MRTCEFCGCRTNAHLRKCCVKGYLADGGVDGGTPFGFGGVWLDNRDRENCIERIPDDKGRISGGHK